MSRLVALLLVGLFLSHLAWAQRVVDQHTRFRFAQLHMGIDGQYLPSVRGGYLTPEGGQRPLSLPSTYYPRFNIGGTHFWGLADFYVSFPLAAIRPKIAELDDYQVSTGVATGARIHPLQLRYHRINPYLGVNWSTLSYSQRVNEVLSGPSIPKDVLMLEGGLNWITGPHWFEVGMQYLPSPTFSYPTSRQTTTLIQFPTLGFQVSYKYLVDVSRPLEKNNEDAFGNYLRQRHALSGFHLDIGPSTAAAIEGNTAKDIAFHLDIGPSTATTLRRSEYNTRTRPYLKNPSGNQFFFDASVGYYFFKPDFDIRLSHRHIQADQVAYGLNQQLDRRSLSLEVYKYLFDYQGFVPFLGLSLSRERLSVFELDNGQEVTNQQEVQYTPGLVFGWDIRPIRYQSLLLRTNLRYSPFLKTQVHGQSISFQQLEFNFIQLVVYPQRLLYRYKYRQAN